MASILLVYPKMKVLAPRFPYSVLPLAAVLLEAGHEVRILDTQVEDLESVDPARYDVAGISSYSGSQIKGGLEAASFVRQKAPEVPIVWGGVHVTTTPDESVEDPLVDMVVRGEGESSLLGLVDALERGGSLREVTGLTFVEDGETVNTPDPEYIDLDQLPFLPYRLLHPERYVHFMEKPSRVYIETSRGCPHNCGFCYNEVVHHRKWRAKSVERVLEEMQYIKDELQVDEIWPSDDNFAVDRGRVEEIARGKIERGLTFNWLVSSRFDYAVKYTDEFLAVLKQSGCNYLSFGGESGCQRMLELIAKGITPDKMRDVTALLKRNGMASGANFMIGYPGETAAERNQTYDLIDELVVIDEKVEPGITIYTPFPGTPLYPLAIEEGFKEPGSLKAWADYLYGVVENLPWLDRKQKRLVRNVGLITSFDFTAAKYRERQLLSGRPVMRLAYRVLNASSRFRWKRRRISFAPEWRLLDLVLRTLGYWER